ncbi:hypothetical protein Poli38472_000919 [Pythium oligandrum]|uniref:tRNA pseudouridine synthase n=1 Tax=Pythium oligandrum TaxID=41045 RepID=A0A8K1CCT8_PYTOL|nr:hypothetical protein Poli38472_000919 [Pythium oligandrum]|eukprot:TMW60877.1 hypothetical protein Poli38472_000919 [Pythium oligandrum]
MSCSDGSDQDERLSDVEAEQNAPRWRYVLHIAYYGTGLVGWQRQVEKSRSGQGSVQELMEDAVTNALGAAKRINVTSASRTDAGTHALYQYATIKVDQELTVSLADLQRDLNERLPEQVRVLGLQPLPASVKPSRFRSKYKKYIYYLQQGYRPDLELGKYSWFLGKRIDVMRLQEAISLLVGTHDFRPFSQGLQKAEFADRSTVRTIVSAKVRVRRNVIFSLDPETCGNGDIIEDVNSLYDACAATEYDEPEAKKRKLDANAKEPARPMVPVHFICVELIATGFLRHMVRRIMGSVRPIAEGTYPVSRMQQILDGELEPGPSAPTKGLWLHRTWLTQEDWDNDTIKDD